MKSRVKSILITVFLTAIVLIGAFAIIKLYSITKDLENQIIELQNKNNELFEEVTMLKEEDNLASLENTNNNTFVEKQAIITYYAALPNECGDGTITASGKQVQNGFIAAPSEFAFGTEIEIDGMVYTVEDRGGYITILDDGYIRLNVFVDRIDGESDQEYNDRVMQMGVKETVVRVYNQSTPEVVEDNIDIEYELIQETNEEEINEIIDRIENNEETIIIYEEDQEVSSKLNNNSNKPLEENSAKEEQKASPAKMIKNTMLKILAPFKILNRYPILKVIVICMLISIITITIFLPDKEDEIILDTNDGNNNDENSENEKKPEMDDDINNENDTEEEFDEDFIDEGFYDGFEEYNEEEYEDYDFDDYEGDAIFYDEGDSPSPLSREDKCNGVCCKDNDCECDCGCLNNCEDNDECNCIVFNKDDDVCRYNRGGIEDNNKVYDEASDVCRYNRNGVEFIDNNKSYK